MAARGVPSIVANYPVPSGVNQPVEEKKDESLLKFESNSDKASYSLGFHAGASVKSQFGQVNVQLLERGFIDAIKDRSPALPPQEIAAIIKSVTAQMQQHIVEQLKAKAKENEAFFQKNVSLPGILKLSDGVQYQILKSGAGDDSPSVDSTVCIHYRSMRLDGTEIENSMKKDSPLQVQIKGVMPGLAKALVKMKAGDKWKIFIPSEQAYGIQGRPPLIEPNCALIYIVRLVEIKKS